MPRRMTYKAAGVFKSIAGRTSSNGVIGGVGGFGAMVALNGAARGMRHPVLVSGTDSVGTKLKIAFATGRHDTVGIDCVAMCVNDIICHGARPLFFLDYIGVGKLKKNVVVELVKGVARGCEMAGASLVGGETCQAGDLYQPGEYDLAGFAVGIVDRNRIPNPRAIRPGDVLIGIGSNGLHSNGFSLARKVLLESAKLKLNARVAELGCTLADELLRPTLIYASIAGELFDRFTLKGLANITGGGIRENVPRVMPDGTRAMLARSSWQEPPIFGLIQRLGKVTRAEMDHTFNNGLGMVAIAAPRDADKIVTHLRRRKYAAWIVGEVRRGPRDAVIA
jgi:phosphoribosylformylglycinamidine cyclo-ligase